MQEHISFNDLPEAVGQLQSQVDVIIQLLTKMLKECPKENEDEIFDLKQTAKFLGLSKATVYSKVSRRELPHMKPGKKLQFSKKELLEYMRASKRMSLSEVNGFIRTES